MAQPPESLVATLVAKLQRAFGDRLVSVVLYGSGAAGDYHAGYSDLNILCILTAVTTRELAAAEDVFHWWRGQSNPSPLLLTVDEIAASTDCFIIEFLDIQKQHRVLYGKDVITGIAIDTNRAASLYRMQVERDLRAKFLRLRQKAAGMMSDQKLLRRLLADSVSTFSVLLRHALELRGLDAPHQKRAVVERAAECFGIDPQPFLQILDLREGRSTPRETDPWKLLAGYMEGIGKTIEAVDRLEPGEAK